MIAIQAPFLCQQKATANNRTKREIDDLSCEVQRRVLDFACILGKREQGELSKHGELEYVSLSGTTTSRAVREGALDDGPISNRDVPSSSRCAGAALCA